MKRALRQVSPAFTPLSKAWLIFRAEHTCVVVVRTSNVHLAYSAYPLVSGLILNDGVVPKSSSVQRKTAYHDLNDGQAIRARDFAW